MALEQRIKGNKTNPIFELENGIELELSPIKMLIVSRWDSEYKKRNPPPQPPIITLENGDPYPDTNNAGFQYLLGQWQAEYNHANVEFLLKAGVKNNPPDGWEYPYPELINGNAPHARVLWLETILENSDLEVLPRLIMGLENITEEGLESAEKN